MDSLFLLTGSNVGNTNVNLEQAKLFIQREIGVVVNQSSVYKTAPWGNQNQQAFLNQVLEIKTDLNAQEVLDKILQIELQMGRVRQTKWEPRVIDIDVLYFSNQIIQTNQLTIPHPLLQQRRFTLIPLVEIAPQFIHPVLLLSNAQLLLQCEDIGEVEKI